MQNNNQNANFNNDNDNDDTQSVSSSVYGGDNETQYRKIFVGGLPHNLTQPEF